MAKTTKTLYKINCTLQDGSKQTITLPDPVDGIDNETLAGAAAAFTSVGLTLVDGYKVQVKFQRCHLQIAKAAPPSLTMLPLKSKEFYA